MNTNSNAEFPKAFYDAAGEVSDARNLLNTSFGDYPGYFYTSDTTEAEESIENLHRLIALRERQIEMAREALATYEAEVKADGPHKYHAFQVESYNRRHTDAEVA